MNYERAELRIESTSYVNSLNKQLKQIQYSDIIILS